MALTQQVEVPIAPIRMICEDPKSVCLGVFQSERESGVRYLNVLVTALAQKKRCRMPTEGSPVKLLNCHGRRM